MLAHILNDMRYGFRQMREHAGFTSSPCSRWRSASAPPARSSASSTASMLQPLPYPRSRSRLVRCSRCCRSYGRFAVAPGELPGLARAEHGVRANCGVHRAGRNARWAPNGPSGVVTSVSWDLFERAGCPPALGRTFRARGGPAEAEQRRRPQPWACGSVVSAAIPRSSGASHRVERRAGDGGRRHAGGLLLPEPGHRVLASARDRPATGPRGGHFIGDDRASRGRRVARAGERPR